MSDQTPRSAATARERFISIATHALEAADMAKDGYVQCTMTAASHLREINRQAKFVEAELDATLKYWEVIQKAQREAKHVAARAVRENAEGGAA